MARNIGWICFANKSVPNSFGHSDDLGMVDLFIIFRSWWSRQSRHPTPVSRRSLAHLVRLSIAEILARRTVLPDSSSRIG
jgi:hypothetical protein